MNNPYQVLGVSSSATDDEIKKAYRTLSKKYHPDANINAPNKDELTEKFKKVQSAYDQIMDERKHGFSSQSYGQSQSNTGGYYNQNSGYKEYQNFEDFIRDFMGGASYSGQNSRNQYQSKEDMYYSAVKNYINQGYYQEALNVLSQMSQKTGSWYYYSAICNGYLGNNVTALEHAQMAVQLEPDVVEYQQLLANIKTGRMNYRRRSQTYGSPMSSYNCCTQILIFNMLLNCCCGMRIC